MKYELIACDVDGTLLTSDRRLTTENIQAVRDAKKRGVTFVIASGRPLSGVKTLQSELGVTDAPLILYNGAMVLSHDGKVIYSLCLSEEVSKIIISEGEKRNSTMIVWKDNNLYTKKPCEKIDFYKKLALTEPTYVDDLTSVCSGGVTKIVWYDDPVSTPKYTKEMNELLKGRAVGFPSRADFLEFVDASCSKGTALKILADYYNIDISKTVAIGDNYNDLPMLETAGLSVAMGNAENDVKHKCDFVTDNCDNSGVSKAIYKILDLRE